MIEEIFEQLKDLGAVSSTDDFSTQWLGRERSYMRCLRAKQRDPSAQVLANLCCALAAYCGQRGHYDTLVTQG